MVLILQLIFYLGKSYFPTSISNVSPCLAKVCLLDKSRILVALSYLYCCVSNLLPFLISNTKALLISGKHWGALSLHAIYSLILKYFSFVLFINITYFSLNTFSSMNHSANLSLNSPERFNHSVPLC